MFESRNPLSKLCTFQLLNVNSLSSPEAKRSGALPPPLRGGRRLKLSCSNWGQFGEREDRRQQGEALFGQQELPEMEMGARRRRLRCTNSCLFGRERVIYLDFGFESFASLFSLSPSPGKTIVHPEVPKTRKGQCQRRRRIYEARRKAPEIFPRGRASEILNKRELSSEDAKNGRTKSPKLRRRFVWSQREKGRERERATRDGEQFPPRSGCPSNRSEPYVIGRERSGSVNRL